ncbi:MAG: hypothetical protein Q8O67_12875 [Deltaproteobacteria bacterium]|nr:hypothetical protein [Deltaproteobacteria bacterium]
MRVVVFVVSALVANVALAEGTALFPVDATGTGSAESKLKRDIPVVVKDVLKAGYRAIAETSVPDGPLKCSQLPACVAKVAAAAGADEVVFIKATRPGPELGADGYAHLELTIFSSDGAKLLGFEQTITNTTGIADLRGLIVRAFAPALYIGHVQLRGVVDGDEVLIDGLRHDKRTDVALRAGPHVARVRHKPIAIGAVGDAVDIPFVVPFEGVVAIDVPPAGTVNNEATSPQLPLYAHGAVTVAVAGTLVGMGVRELYWRAAASHLERSTCQITSSDESGADFKNLGVNPLGVCTGVQSELHQWVQLNRDLHLTIGLGMTALAAATTTALVLTAVSLSEPLQEP